MYCTGTTISRKRKIRIQDTRQGVQEQNINEKIEYCCINVVYGYTWTVGDSDERLNI